LESYLNLYLLFYGRA